MTEGMFVTFEGIDGCGKTTLLRNIENWLRNHDDLPARTKRRSVLATREPGGTHVGEALREIVLEWDGKLTSEAEFFIMLAARAEHAKKIQEKKESGYIILCDRYTDSSIAYQSFGRGLRLESVNVACHMAQDRVTPDLTFFVDTPVDIALQRRKDSRPDNIESTINMEAVRAGFLHLAAKNPERVCSLDGTLSEEDLLESAIEIFRAFV